MTEGNPQDIRPARGEPGTKDPGTWIPGALPAGAAPTDAPPVAAHIPPPLPTPDVPHLPQERFASEQPGPTPPLPIDVVVRPATFLLPLIQWFIFIVIFLSLATATFPLWRQLKSGAWLALVGLSLVAAAIQGIIPRIQRRRAAKRVIRRSEQWSDLASPDIARWVHRKRPWLSGVAAHAEMARRLARLGRHGESYRFAAPNRLTPLEPLAVDFEPRLLDQTDPAFNELYEATRPASDLGGDDNARHGSGDVSLTDRVWRNITLKGGLTRLMIVLAFLSLSIWSSISASRVTIGVYVWGILLLVRLFAPATGGAGGSQWLVVPGGVLIIASDRKGPVRVLMTRRDSVLVAYQLRQRHWALIVGNPLAALSTSATRREAEFLLRAWLSPIAPPSAARAMQYGNTEGLGIAMSAERPADATA